MSPLPLFLLLAAPLAFALHHHGPARRALPDSWYHPRDHPVHKLFRRGGTDGTTYPAVGTPEWSAGFPPAEPDPKALPQAWLDALNAAVAAGKIPNIPVSTSTNGSNPAYSDATDPTGAGPTICSSTAKCRGAGDIWDAPDGVLGTGFDDGPLPASDALYQFLQSQNVHATHFMIGINIVANPSLFTFAFETLQDDIAGHTWTHPYMTTQTNEQVVGQLGWTMELIHNSTGGRVTKYWRPPYGDSDNRVRAIAKEVFGLEAILWNQDTDDWSIGEAGGTTVEFVNANLTAWIAGPKSPGLIILEHELTNQTVQCFIDAFPQIKANGWNIVSQASMANAGGAWVNLSPDGASVLPKGILAGDLIVSPTPSTTSVPATSATLGAVNSAPSGSSGAVVAQSNGASPALEGVSWMLSVAAGSLLMSFL